jgi:hypothetical protein
MDDMGAFPAGPALLPINRASSENMHDRLVLWVKSDRPAPDHCEGRGSTDPLRPAGSSIWRLKGLFRLVIVLGLAHRADARLHYALCAGPVGERDKAITHGQRGAVLWPHFAKIERICSGADDAAPNLIGLDRFKQRLEIALAEAFIALALDEFEKDRPDHII